jgi:hypothetical protein
MALGVPCLILDLDGSLPAQPTLAHHIRQGDAVLVSARDLGPRLRIVAGRHSLEALRGRIDAAFPVPSGAAPLIFYGSGDFHHLAAFFLQGVREPVTVLHFDNHPDWTGFPASWNCGAWVNRALENPLVQRIVTIGPTSDDFVRPEWQFANLAAIRSGRLEVHPWHAEPSRIWGQPVNGPGCDTRDGAIHWRNLDSTLWQSFSDDLDRRLPQGGLWVSLDKDVLTPAEAVTNWDQGGMGLDAVMGLIHRLARTRRLLGMDVCGDYSTPRFSDPFRWFLSATDRPRSPWSDPDSTRTINDGTNRRILRMADQMVHERIWPT